MGLMAAITWKGVLIGRRRGEAQEFAQCRCASLVQGRAHSHLDGFQIQPPRPSATIEDDAQQLVYFARDLLADGFRRFFSSGESTSGSDGRIWQICALTSIRSLCRACSFRNSVISLSAFALRAGRGGIR